MLKADFEIEESLLVVPVQESILPEPLNERELDILLMKEEQRVV
jgi:hypothetical protein